jgi:hypothetical protein
VVEILPAGRGAVARDAGLQDEASEKKQSRGGVGRRTRTRRPRAGRGSSGRRRACRRCGASERRAARRRRGAPRVGEEGRRARTRRRGGRGGAEQTAAAVVASIGRRRSRVERGSRASRARARSGWGENERGEVGGPAQENKKKEGLCEKGQGRRRGCGMQKRQGGC